MPSCSGTSLYLMALSWKCSSSRPRMLVAKRWLRCCPPFMASRVARRYSRAAMGYGTTIMDVGDIMSQFREPSVSVEKQKLLQVAMVGVPNAGKSTLVNRLVGQKVSAVSHKTNTTVSCRLGAFTEGTAQVILYDTPGVVGREHYMNAKHRQRVESAWVTAGDCDLLLYILDAERQFALPDPRIERLIGNLSKSSSRPGNVELPPAILVLNKVDLIPPDKYPSLGNMEEHLRSLHEFEASFRVSAARGHNMDELRQFLLDRATPGEWALAGEAKTDTNDAEMALEITREKVFRRYHAELPYEIRIVPQSFSRLEDGSVHVEELILVKSDNVKKIIMGKGAAAIKAVGTGTRLELERMWGKRVHLFLTVKVKK